MMTSRSLLYKSMALACLVFLACTIAASQSDSAYVDPAISELKNQVMQSESKHTGSYKGEPWATSSLNESNIKAASAQAISASQIAAGQATSPNYMAKADSFLKAAAENGYYVMSISDFITKSSTDANWAIIDVRPGQLYAAGHIPGAINIPLENLISQMGMIPANKKVAVYCSADTNAAIAVETLRVFGDREAFVLSGGVSAWQMAGMSLVQ
jgi:rhodanese-related sulfurtransferase